ncbi:DNA protecting protein DprA [Microbacterium sp. SLBN-146]|nr:DNA protecting protein DprA [Microbacterium sp. SLBN-146]
MTPRTARESLGRLAVDDDDTTVVVRYARAIWSALVEPGDGVAGRFIGALGAVEALRVVVAAAAGSGPPAMDSDDLKRGCERWIPRLKKGGVSDALAVAGRTRVRLVIPEDADWPRSLADLGDHEPVALWARGDTDALRRSPVGVAIVGARASTAYGDRVAGELATELGSSGITVVSGAAYGIDGSAHRAALAVDALTVAFLAGGVEEAYPRGHTRLIDTIAERGLLLSEAPCGSRPTKWRFLH